MIVLSRMINEAREEIIELGDEDADGGKWKYGTEYRYTDDDFTAMDEDEGDLDEDGNTCGLFADDRVNRPDADGLILVNVGHPDNEQPIYLPPQITDVIKPHQVGGCSLHVGQHGRIAGNIQEDRWCRLYPCPRHGPRKNDPSRGLYFRVPDAHLRKTRINYCSN